MDDETLTAVRGLRLKLRAAKGLIRDLTIAAADVERLLSNINAEPQEAERDHEKPERYSAAA